MALLRPRILSFEIKKDAEEPTVLFRFGTDELTKPIPAGHGIVRASAILDAEGKLADCELITEKL